MSSSIKKKLVKAKFKKKLKEWEYLKSLERDTRDILGLYDADLSEVISDLHKFSIKGRNIEEEEREREKREEQERNKRREIHESLSEDEVAEKEADHDSKSAKSENINTPGWVKKLYKKLALETHPDKLSRMDLLEEEKIRREEIFKQASDFINSKDYDSLLEFANELDIEVDIEDEQQLELIQISLKKVNKELSKLKKQIAWGWGEADNKKEKLSYLMWVRTELSLESIPTEVIKEYLASREKDDIDSWIKKYVDDEQNPLNDKNKKEATQKHLNKSYHGKERPKFRKPGERPESIRSKRKNNE